MAVIERITSILFCDMKGYSAIKVDDQKTKLLQILKKIIGQHVRTAENHCYMNSFGDGYIICNYSPIDLAEIGLHIRDDIENTDWGAEGFSSKFLVRVALHAGSIQLTTGTKGIVTEVAGVAVDTCARIEPVVTPGEVYCSDVFHQLLDQVGPGHIKTVFVGKRQLAKNYGEITLHKVVWNNIASAAVDINTRIVAQETAIEFSLTVLNHLLGQPPSGDRKKDLEEILRPLVGLRGEALGFPNDDDTLYNFVVYVYNQENHDMELAWRDTSRLIIPLNRNWPVGEGHPGLTYYLKKPWIVPDTQAPEFDRPEGLFTGDSLVQNRDGKYCS